MNGQTCYANDLVSGVLNMNMDGCYANDPNGYTLNMNMDVQYANTATERAVLWLNVLELYAEVATC